MNMKTILKFLSLILLIAGAQSLNAQINAHELCKLVKMDKGNRTQLLISRGWIKGDISQDEIRKRKEEQEKKQALDQIQEESMTDVYFFLQNEKDGIDDSKPLLVFTNTPNSNETKAYFYITEERSARKFQEELVNLKQFRSQEEPEKTYYEFENLIIEISKTQAQGDADILQPKSVLNVLVYSIHTFKNQSIQNK